ncbi:signal transduction histidine kinase [Saccharopolyspora erythraea NRRL 2338]|uniref:histidine kinase n=2 Tax=Saccharopolyspora erythraea TaxID=1836 RepID=A4FQT3_SACEN|nr:histidine kinase [Saccharopolyspora erythraea]EQD87651.1 histidine kinase [Saccharopolyspora erythraea D]PFG93010.1 signal transduction histidine kinase [Saccharopolyspora erythraea NRRL 2338]QRK89898.1 two-component sensor histidine kinase [Saccharopolyspora erythraea]CAM06408.1 hypothetical protein SACE_7250 [Saccharopolyspora erythraea NRRL 2338]
MSELPTHPTASTWPARLCGLVRAQWIFALVIGLAWCGEMVHSIDRSERDAVVLPGLTAMAALAVLASRWPVFCGLAGAFALGASTVAIDYFNADSYSFGLLAVRPTENIAGLAMVVHVFWLRRKRYAIPVTTALVVSCLAALFARTGTSYVHASQDVSRSIGVGFVELVLAVGTGVYLRGRKPRSDDTPLQALLRRQWPVMGVLFAFLCLELLSGQGVMSTVIVALGGAVLAVLAVLAPLRPSETAMLGAVALATTALTMWITGAGANTWLLGPISPSAIASGMILLAFSTRYAPPRNAVRNGCALVGAALFALFVTPSDDSTRVGDYLNYMFMGGLLLVLSVGTGVYFRARDDERARTVHNAVSSAQQAERMALARELHDVVAHHVTGIVVQAQAAQLVSEKNPRAATEALARIADSGTEALTAMRRLVASMRGAEPAGASRATEQATTDLEADLLALVEGAQRHGAERADPARIDLSVDIRHEIPLEVARSALRVVQESLTNSGKHALDVSRVEVAVTSNETHLHTRVSDDGTGTHARPVGGSGGYGLVGMRERVELLGGRFHAGPGDHVGWRVEAWLPLGEQNKEEEGAA